MGNACAPTSERISLFSYLHGNARVDRHGAVGNGLSSDKLSVVVSSHGKTSDFVPIPLRIGGHELELLEVTPARVGCSGADRKCKQELGSRHRSGF